jgi:hypothetical protein
MGYPAVAYYEKDGSGFLGTDTPLIINDFECKNDAVEKRNELVDLGYKNVKLFDHPFDEEREEDEITKEYVDKHLL